MKLKRLLIVLALFAAGCGSDSTPAPAPTPPTPTVSNLVIAGVDALRTGFFGTYEATATLSNGSTQTVTTTTAWTSSNPAVASVDGTTLGRLNATSHGVMNLSATYQGRTATKQVSIVNNYGGTWSGTYLLATCDQSGIFNSGGWCQGLGGTGSVLPWSLSLDQSISADRTAVRGTISLGTITGNTSGNVTGDGRLVIGGTFVFDSGGPIFQITIGGWETRLSGANMTGKWASSLSAVNITGNAYMEHTIVSSNHLTPQATPAPAPMMLNLTMEQATAAMH